ncbi:membrane dipeptidase-domain-containing protein [Lactarius hengduanensis]|nr:membrane dipeptidase-domain-containing protein [Lactarius hengduanensis]
MLLEARRMFEGKGLSRADIECAVLARGHPHTSRKVLIARSDTLEQIDISHQQIHKYSDTFELVLTPRDVISAKGLFRLLTFRSPPSDRAALGALRQFAAALGVRWVTLTHTCHVIADSSGLFDGIEPLHGLRCAFLPIAASQLNRRTLNRLGVLVDLSHMSDDTALAAHKIPRAPVIWSHSSTRALCDIPRNVPDEALQHVGTGVGQLDGVVMVCTRPSHRVCTDVWMQVNFLPGFVSEDPDRAEVKTVADYVDHIVSVAGRAQHVAASSSHRTFPFARLPSSSNIYLLCAGSVGIGSDYDGIDRCSTGLEDVSTYPVLVRSCHGPFTASRSDTEPLNYTAEDVAREGVAPAQDLYEKRTDIPKKH